MPDALCSRNHGAQPTVCNVLFRVCEARARVIVLITTARTLEWLDKLTTNEHVPSSISAVVKTARDIYLR